MSTTKSERNYRLTGITFLLFAVFFALNEEVTVLPGEEDSLLWVIWLLLGSSFIARAEQLRKRRRRHETEEEDAQNPAK